MIDIRHDRCITCKKVGPNFNYPNEEKALYCNDWKKCGMIYISHKKCINCNLSRANKNIIIIAHFVLLTYFQMIQEQLKQDLQKN